MAETYNDGVNIGNINIPIIKGERGNTGDRGETGEQGVQGKSAYEIAVENGFEGSEEEWLESLKAIVYEWARQPQKPTYTAEEVGALPENTPYITNSVNNLINYYLKSETYTKQEVLDLIGQLQKLSKSVVEELPEVGESNVIYLVPKEGSLNDTYNEYIYINNTWEKIGSTDVDLTGYATEEYVDEEISNINETIGDIASILDSINGTEV